MDGPTRRGIAKTAAWLVGIITFGGLLFLALSDSMAGEEVGHHPLDPLDAQEYSTVVSAIDDSGLATRPLYPLVTLQEPPKEQVRAWNEGDPVPRVAFAIVRDGPDTFEATVDTVDGTVLSWEQIDNVQPGLLLTEEFALVQSIVVANREWQAAVALRGVSDVTDVVCVPNPVGYFGIEEDAGRRLVKAICYAPSGSSNYWGRPIEGLIAVVDLDERDLIRIIDTGPLPVPAGPVDLDEPATGDPRQAPNAISIVQPDGPSFELSGREVHWQKWNFHYRLDPRLGPVVSLVSYDDGGQRRSVMYQGSLSEVFIPYMDPDVGWGFRTYLDAGETGVGRLAVPLQPDFDCPNNAVFLDAVFAADTGEPVNHPRAACIFERFSGDIAWRHYESVGGRTDVRPRTDLVVRSISAIGNYDYIFDWVFRQDGTVRVDVGATGIPQVKAVDEDASGSHSAYGHLVAEHTVAVNHDHFFVFRLDVDVDGSKNSFVSDELVTETIDSADGRKSVWVVESTTVANERDARMSIDSASPAQWRFINPDVEGAWGNPVGYELKPGANAVSLLSRDDFPQQRAGFTDHHLWVTPYDPDEIYAAGRYPNQSAGGEGLPSWTAENRSILDADLVAWYTLGFHHAPRAEDWPVTPTIWLDFELRPFDFFDRNPALDIPAGR